MKHSARSQRVHDVLLERFGPPVVPVDLVEGTCCSQCGMMPTEVDGGCCSEELDEKAPPGRERQVKALKKVPGIDNPYAVAWAAHNKQK